MKTGVKLIDESRDVRQYDRPQYALKVHTWLNSDIVAIEETNYVTLIKDGKAVTKPYNCLSDMQVAFGQSNLLVGMPALAILHQAFKSPTTTSTGEQP